MSARSNIIEHPLGVRLETPLMVPSFSSKGYGFKKKRSKRAPDTSEVADAFQFAKEFLTETLLVSAYDIFYSHIPFDEDSICTELTFIDSGGYETGGGYDISATSKFNYDIKAWDVNQLNRVLSKWPEHKAAIAVSYDHGNHRISLKDQIDSAKALFSTHSNFLSDFLIKPETKDQQFVKVQNIIDNIQDLSGFSIIGLTERELGSSILNRMINIAEIRRALDNAGISSPLHIFGSLDPITTILYFLVGAEIFDGLTWLKYSYYNDSAIYQSNYGALNVDLGIHVSDAKVKSMSITQNTYYLEKMKYIMKDFIEYQDFEQFDELGGPGFGKILEKHFKTFQSNFK
ncbi:hypothetical protein [Fluviicola sp.]|uniref:hypothetical protein n=1 Tax=Fluviicola sp. TaxID=1917219 RepID=UPI0031E06B1C